jgi:hypothetical protein
MLKLYKPVLLIFILTLLLLLLESGYYFFYLPWEASLSSETPKVIDSRFLETLNSLQKGVVKRSIVRNVYEGEAAESDLKGGRTKQFVYPYKIKLRSASGQINTIYLFEDEIKGLVIWEEDKGKNRPMNIKDIRIGDLINITEDIDLLHGQHYFQIKRIVKD